MESGLLPYDYSTRSHYWQVDGAIGPPASPARNCATIGLREDRNSSGVPSSTILPSLSNARRVATRKALRNSCVTTIHVQSLSAWRRTINSSMMPLAIGSKPAVGSSNITSSGSITKARATAIRFLMPPLNSLGNDSLVSGKPTNPSFSSTIASISFRVFRVISSSGRARLSRTFSELIKAEY